MRAVQLLPVLLHMTLPGHARPIRHLVLEVREVLATIAALRRHTRAPILSFLFLFLVVAPTFVSPVGATKVLLILALCTAHLRLLLLFSWRLLDFEGGWKLALLDQALLEQVVYRSHLVVLVSI